MRGIKFDKKKNQNVGPGRPDKKKFGQLDPKEKSIGPGRTGSFHRARRPVSRPGGL